MKYRPHQVVKDELFNPEDPRNVETDQLMGGIGILMSETMFKEFRDEKKETFKNIWSNNDIYSWRNATDAER